MKKLLVLFKIFLGSSFIIGQVGIGTTTPSTTTALDIFATDKGILLPQYTLTVLNNNTSPINNPVVGALIYNTGGTFSKGYYFWNGTNWTKLIVDAEFNQVMKLTYITAASPAILIPDGTTNNTIGDFTVDSNRIVGASESAAGTITLPTGKYRIEYFIDAIRPTSTNSGGALVTGGENFHFFAYSSYIANTTGAALTTVLNDNNLTSYGGGSWISVKFTFYFEVTTPTQSIRLGLRHGTQSSTTLATEVNLGRGSHFVITKFYEGN
ncbi:hypothetical protein CHRY9390_03109 [Chryseobacterium aquaeductus]|uniref:C1q domain-containing protein n=1 Tax=Chryseobacterium aquaeductus TaxID=2675056 RepID=A0A9N8MJM8_9FLAO|nr:hypothetical protein [Chryseobacterium aquaeductus]CAA7332387.1 hypothetical protein CHRY9390_03109 [Chryseobacterium potabilaquae]CAD7816144.1 hypothetical protein CHRY9390_03109 [Chryseobacterium aquaeductus]